MSIDKENTKVTMSLKDYEELAAYEKSYKELIKNIRKFAYIDSITSNGAIVAIDKEKAGQFIYPFTADDLEFDGIEDKVKIEWK